MFFITCQRILQEKTGLVAYVVTKVLWVVHNPLDIAIQIFFPFLNTGDVIMFDTRLL